MEQCKKPERKITGSTEDLDEWDNLTRYYQRRGVEVFGDDPDEWEKNKQRKRLERMRIARRQMKKC